MLAQNDSPRALGVLKNIAKGTSTPDLHNRAIDYLGTHGGRESRAALAEIYGATPDVDGKRRILRAFMVAGDKDRLLSAAQSEQNPDLRAEAVRQLGVMGAHEELWQLYQKETAVASRANHPGDVRRRQRHAAHRFGQDRKIPELRARRSATWGVWIPSRRAPHCWSLQQRQGSGDPPSGRQRLFQQETRRPWSILPEKNRIRP